jgi:kynureninase
MRGRAMAATVGAVIALLVAAAPAGAVQTRTSSASDTKSWCAAVIRANTNAGTMKNKRFLPIDQVPASAWKKVIDLAATQGDRFIAIAPSEIKTAVTHEIAWFKRIKANHYSRTTPLGSWTLAEVKQITNFEKTKCGIRFG